MDWQEIAEELATSMQAILSATGQESWQESEDMWQAVQCALLLYGEKKREADNADQ